MEGVPSTAIEVLLQNLINAAKEEYLLIRGLKKDVEQLQKTLKIIQGYLNDAEKKSISKNSVKNWLRELEVVALDADNVLDELSYHHLRKEVKAMMTPKPKKKVLSCFSSLNSITRSRNMALKIKEINMEFECINKKATELGLQSIVANAPDAPLNTSSETNSFASDPIFIGMDGEVLELVKKLTHFPQEVKFSILAIVGMGGMGKTTLTRKVLDGENIKERFGSLIWVHVSQTFDPFMLFKKILSVLLSQSKGGVQKKALQSQSSDGVASEGGDRKKALLSQSSDGVESEGGVQKKALPLQSSDGVESEQSVLEKLNKALEGKTYLLVLDDVWNEDFQKWENFINSISGVTSTDGNAIIITTRSYKVASLVGPFHTHPLKGLSDEDCLTIIKAKAFGSGDFPSRGFEMIGREIAKRCKHMPLAANVAGGVLRQNKSEKEWRSINEKWVSDGIGGENISKILKMSYDHLPSPSLKKCFAYCSIFPKGMLIGRQEVIEQWMAEGFLQGDEMEGNKFFNVLRQNSLLQYLFNNKYINEEFYVMHDLVHDMASVVLGYSNGADGISPVRYLTTKQEHGVKHLRVLLFEGQISENMFEDLKYLHVLRLECDQVKVLPNSIRKMIHLRNLNISNTWIEELPDWIGELYHLQTLRAKNDHLRELPSSLKYLIKLRHLYVRSSVKLPAEIGRLNCLQTLMHFRVGDNKGYQIEELGSLNLKGELWIHNLEKVHGKEEALKANMFQKPDLFDLKFEWDSERGEGETNDESVLEGLQPHQNLKKLGIFGFKGKRFPLWSENGLQGSKWEPLLIEITLKNCEECEEIPKLEYLENLKSLSLKGLKKLRSINSSFNKLISLCIDKLDELECLPDLLFCNNQNLSKLEISGCPKLRELPDGLQTLNSLEELIIVNCQNLSSIGSSSGGVGQSQGILRRLKIQGCKGLKELPRQMVESSAPSLLILELVGLSCLENLPKLMDCLAKSSRLTKLNIFGVPKVMAACSVEGWDLGSLRTLEIDVSKEWSMESSVATANTVNGILQGCCNTLYKFTLKGSENWESLPESIQHLTSLSYLKIVNSGVEELPQWFGNLSTLKELRLHSCKKLRCLPSGNALENLAIFRRLYIEDCPELLIDPEWRNIPHLKIYVNRHWI